MNKQDIIIYGSHPKRLVEKERRQPALRTGVYRIAATSIIIAAGCCCGKCVSPACRRDATQRTQ